MVMAANGFLCTHFPGAAKDSNAKLVTRQNPGDQTIPRFTHEENVLENCLFPNKLEPGPPYGRIS